MFSPQPNQDRQKIRNECREVLASHIGNHLIQHHSVDAPVHGS